VYGICYHWTTGLLLLPILNAYVLFYLAARLPFSFWDRFGDYSYGLYIYAFPVQQTLAAFGVPAAGIVPYVALAATITAILALLSWRLVEEPMMRLR
ncbi:MAG: acyltransferase, partial [Actinomycetota bacterium]|nr:acyltransferase [Actinomycetota bacterium]